LTPLEARIEYERGQAKDAWRRAETEAAPADALPWLDRAHRYVPGDQNIAFSLALTRLADGDAAGALELFTEIAVRHPTREVRCGIATAWLAMGRTAEAGAEVGRALASSVPNQVLASLATRVCQAGGEMGWCGLRDDGRPLFEATEAVAFTLDGRAVTLATGGALPRGWVQARRLEASAGGRPLLGSPIDISSIRRTEGVVELTEDGIAGWAWHPGAPETDPVLTVSTAAGKRQVTATDLSVSFRGTSPLARPRGFRLAADTSWPVRVQGHDKRDLLGSPLGGSMAVPRAPRPGASGGTAVIIPVYRGAQDTLACIESVLATIGPDVLVIVVNDASPESALVEALGEMAARGRIALVAAHPGSRPRNVGFPAAVNAGLRAAGGRDVVLLNSDTLVFSGWLAALRAAAHSAPDIGTATPIGNDATIFSYPDPTAPAPMPEAAEGAALARLAEAANEGVVVDVPTGHGFCLYIRADCLFRTGLLRPNLFAQGYGEENDFTERARALGWRHVAVPGVYVAHRGGVSFGPAREHLLARNGAILARLHPEYLDRVTSFIKADPLLPARRRLDAARWRARAGDAVLLISHGGIGGTIRVVAERCAAIAAAGRRPVVLRGHEGRTTVDAAEGFPNLRFDLPAELPALAELLASARPVAAEIHHLRDQDFSVLTLLDRFAIPFDVWVHDYLWLCPRLSLVTGDGRFCGEPPAEACVACVARWGDGLESRRARLSCAP
jgi:GT2 family glycosyltransferase